MESPQNKDFQILYDVADATWVPHTRAVCDFVISGNQVVRTVFDKASQRFVALFAAKTNTGGSENLASIIESIIERNPEISKRCFLSVPKTLLVPSVLFDEKMQDTLMANQQKIDDSDSISSFPVKRLDAQMIFAYGQNFKSLKDNTGFQIKTFLPVDAAWLDTLYLKHRESSGYNAHVNISDGFISMAVFNESGLQFYNTFLAATPEEILYFVMFVSEELRISPLRDNYYYSGYIRKGDEVFNLLTQYIKNFKAEDRPTPYSFCMPMLEMPVQLFYNSYCTPVCE